MIPDDKMIILDLDSVRHYDITCCVVSVRPVLYRKIVQCGKDHSHTMGKHLCGKGELQVVRLGYAFTSH